MEDFKAENKDIVNLEKQRMTLDFSSKAVQSRR